MNLPDIKADLLRKLSIENPADAPANIVDDVLTAVNMAGQILNAAGDPFWLLDTVTADVSVSVTSKALVGHSVKAVKSPDSMPLLRCDSLHQLKQYALMYLGETEAQVFQAQAYYVDVSSAGVTLHFGPETLASETLSVEYCPAFVPWTLADLDDAQKSPIVPLEYVETIFLPLARYYITRSHWFEGEELLARLQQDFASSVAVIRQVNPALKIPYADQKKRSWKGSEAS